MTMAQRFPIREKMSPKNYPPVKCVYAEATTVAGGWRDLFAVAKSLVVLHYILTSSTYSCYCLSFFYVQDASR